MSTYLAKSPLWLVIVLALLGTRSSEAQADLFTRGGDVGAVLLPGMSMAPSIFEGDRDGYRDFARCAVAYSATMATTYALKLAINRARPDTGGLSFPSGHTSSAFSGATLIQMKYGTRFGIPAYILAALVGYSRVHADRHYWSDVIAGAILGTGMTYLVYGRWTRKWAVTPAMEDRAVGLRFDYTF